MHKIIRSLVFLSHHIILFQKHIEANNVNTNFIHFTKKWNTEPAPNLYLDVSEKTSEDILVTNSSRIHFFNRHMNKLSGIHISLSTYTSNNKERDLEIILLTTLTEVSLCKILWTNESNWIFLNPWSQIFQCIVYLISVYLNLSTLNIECLFPKEIISSGVSIQRSMEANFGLQLSTLDFMKNYDFEEMHKLWRARNSVCNSAVEPLMHMTCAQKFASPVCCGLVQNFRDAECECARAFIENSRNMANRLESELSTSKLNLFCFQGFKVTELNRNCMAKSIFLRKASIQLQPYNNIGIFNISEVAQVEETDLWSYKSYAPTQHNSYFSESVFNEWLVGRPSMTATHNQSANIDESISSHIGVRAAEYGIPLDLGRVEGPRHMKRTSLQNNHHIQVGANLFMKPLKMVATICIVFPVLIAAGYIAVRLNKERY